MKKHKTGIIIKTMEQIIIIKTRTTSTAAFPLIYKILAIFKVFCCPCRSEASLQVYLIYHHARPERYQSVLVCPFFLVVKSKVLKFLQLFQIPNGCMQPYRNF